MAAKLFDFEWRMTGIVEFDGRDLEVGLDASVSGSATQEPLSTTDNIKNFFSNRWEDLKGVVKAGYNFTLSLAKTLVDLVAKINYLRLKLFAVIETIALIALNIVPLAIVGVTYKLANKIFGFKSNFGSDALARARSIADNNIKLATVGMLASQALTFLELASVRQAVNLVTGFIPGVARIVIATAASIWHDKINVLLNNVAFKLGLTDREVEPRPVSDEAHNDNIAQFVGSSAALAAASVAAPVALTGLVAPAVVSAVGANVGFYALKKYRDMQSSNSADDSDPEQGAAPAAQPARAAVVPTA